MTDAQHRRPDGVDDATVAAVGTVTEALEWVERARGHLYEFHQLMGHADARFGDAADELEAAGHPGQAAALRMDVVGRNALDGRWSFQIVEEYDDLYWTPVRQVELAVRDQLLQGRRHVYESEMKEDRRSHGRAHHESRPPAAHDPEVVAIDEAP